MVVVERLVQEINMDKWAELEALDKQYDVVEARLGFPPKRRLRVFAGPHHMNTLIIEREWGSVSEMEAVYEQAEADPELMSLWADNSGIIKTSRMELYTPL